MGCFNPHSPLLANEFLHGWGDGAGCGVSIHIRHCWRMNYRGSIKNNHGTNRFNPHSPLLANELIFDARRLNTIGFQSTFAIAGE